MTPAQRLFDLRRAFDQPFTVHATVAIGVLVVGSGILIALMPHGRKGHADLITRWRSWVWISLLSVGVILLGAAWVMAAVALISLFCYREFARATGLFRTKAISAVVVLAILADTFAVLDHYDRLFFATAPLTMACIAMVTIPFDQPKGYVQRLGLGSLGFLLCGFSLAYISCIANDPSYRAILLLVLLGVEMNDVFAYCTGKSIGGAKLLPNTSPGKTIAGSVGAIVLTTPLVAFMAHAVFRGSAIDSVHALFVLGVLVSVMGQMGDLVLSSIKRDVGIKDFDVVIPGHGGLLDRFDSLILVVPAVYHYLSLYLGPLGGSQPARIITGR